jgi:NAD(P)-dependent dehydrogenase (short-subunit alcohol dehydrogenase family)
MRLKGKVVLITGGGSGLGREMGLLFASEGAKVGVNDVRPEAAQNVMTEIERAGGVARPRRRRLEQRGRQENVRRFSRRVRHGRYPFMVGQVISPNGGWAM